MLRYPRELSGNNSPIRKDLLNERRSPLGPELNLGEEYQSDLCSKSQEQ